jgi:hypothetical protein
MQIALKLPWKLSVSHMEAKLRMLCSLVLEVLGLVSLLSKQNNCFWMG